MKNICIVAVPARKYIPHRLSQQDKKKKDGNILEKGYLRPFIGEGRKP